MLTCRDVTDHATDFLDGALPLRMSMAVRLHLSICRMCRAYLDQLRKTAALLRGQGLSPPSPEIEARLLAARRKDGPAA